jgi:hypothetical protein
MLTPFNISLVLRQNPDSTIFKWPRRPLLHFSVLRDLALRAYPTVSSWVPTFSFPAQLRPKCYTAYTRNTPLLHLNITTLISGAGEHPVGQKLVSGRSMTVRSYFLNRWLAAGTFHPLALTIHTHCFPSQISPTMRSGNQYFLPVPTDVLLVIDIIEAVIHPSVHAVR